MTEAAHDFDDEGICNRCGLDGAEFAYCRSSFRAELAPYESPETVRAEVNDRFPWPDCISPAQTKAPEPR